MHIKTKFNQARHQEGEYISAIADGIRMLSPWNPRISAEKNHAKLAEQLAKILEWDCDSIVGVPHKNGYSWKPKASGYYHSIKKEGK